MADRQIDPARLQGEALRKWYLRSPQDLERERQRTATQRHTDFFSSPAHDPGSSLGLVTPRLAIAPSISRRTEPSDEDIGFGITWIATGQNRWRGDPAGPGQFQQSDKMPGTNVADGAVLDRELAGADDGGELIDIGNPHNRRLKREHIRKYGDWPKTGDGRDYDVAHRRAIADGGTNTLDNIEPMHPDEHSARHLNDGDSARWGRRAGIAQAFGGTVEPPRAMAKLRGFAPIDPSIITGIGSGRIRLDSFSNFSSDLVGVPSPQDMARRRRFIDGLSVAGCPPGADCV